MKKALALMLASLMLVSTCTGCATSTEVVEEAAVETEITVPDEVEETTYVYATMNIPYSDFYAEELADNDVDVDVVSSATTSKWSMYDYTYSAEAADGSGGGSIYGPKYPVYLSEDLFEELSALDEAEAYYVTLLDATPETYKEVTADASGNLTFSAMVASTTSVVDDVTCEMSYPSNWGDFEIHLTGLPSMSTIYGVELVTDSGKSYGLRTLENIWSNGSQLSWGMGFMEMISKGNVLSSEHYADMQGQTITEIIYYVPEGTVSVPVDVYVPYLYTDTLFAIGEVSGKSSYLELGDLSATVVYTEGVTLPADLAVGFIVTNSTTGQIAENVVLSDDMSTVSWTADVAPGSYSVEIADANGVYMPYAVSVVFRTDIIPVSFDASTLSFAAANGASEDTVSAYLATISSYTVAKDGEEQGTSYSVNENHGTPGTPLLTEDGSIDLSAEGADGAVFEAGSTYTVAFTVTGYTEFAITFTA